MRQLLPTYSDEVDLRVAYAYPPGRTWVRANMVTSLDGSAVQDGRSEGLSGTADKEVFGVLRGLADVVLVGAGTARAEGYKAPRTKPSYADLRAGLGQRPAPVLALVSRRLDLDPASALFTGDERTIVITTEDSDQARRSELAEVCDVVLAGTGKVDIEAAIDRLAERGLARILCEGGPTLLGDLINAGRLDELCLTISPKAVGGGGTRIVQGEQVDQSLALGHLLEHDDVLLSRYLTD